MPGKIIQQRFHCNEVPRGANACGLGSSPRWLVRATPAAAVH